MFYITVNKDSGAPEMFKWASKSLNLSVIAVLDQPVNSQYPQCSNYSTLPLTEPLQKKLGDLFSKAVITWPGNNPSG